MGLNCINSETTQAIRPMPFLTKNLIYIGDKIMAALCTTKKQSICQVENCDKPTRRNDYCERHAMQITRCGKILETYFDKPSTTCKIKNCYTKIYSDELCKKHYNQIEQYGEIVQTDEDFCKVEGCGLNVKSSGYCTRHSMQIYRHGRIIETYFDKPSRICSVDGCGLPHSSRGYCSKHSMQFHAHGKILKRTQFDPNEFRFDGNDCYMILYNENNVPKTETVFDRVDYERIKQCKWSLTTCGYVFCGANTNTDKEMYLSRFLLSPIQDGFDVDHKDRNPLNNRQENLRLATRQQNTFNISLQKNNTSGFKGVHWHNWHQQWRATICKNRKAIHLGYFHSKIDAAKVYNQKALELFGEFAWLNPIDNLEGS